MKINHENAKAHKDTKKTIINYGFDRLDEFKENNMKIYVSSGYTILLFSCFLKFRAFVVIR